MTGNQTICLALLRGINVGGRNLISKNQLVDFFAGLGLNDVSTYIQSGNVLFRSTPARIAGLTGEIEQGLEKKFAYPARAVVITEPEYHAMVKSAHRDWGKREDRKHNALFTLSEISPSQVIDELPPPEKGVEKVSRGPGVLFWSADKKRLAETTMMKLSKSRLYKLLTVRNHNTVFKLQQLLNDMAG